MHYLMRLLFPVSAVLTWQFTSAPYEEAAPGSPRDRARMTVREFGKAMPRPLASSSIRRIGDPTIRKRIEGGTELTRVACCSRVMMSASYRANSRKECSLSP